MKISVHFFMPTAVIMLSFASCDFLFPEGEDCAFLIGNTSAGYVIEIQGIPDIKQIDTNNKTISVFYDWKEKTWFASREYYFPKKKPSKRYEDIVLGGGLRSKKVRLDPSWNKLRLWIESSEYTCRSSMDESIPAFKNRIGFVGFRLHYNDRIYDGSDLLNFKKGKMFINKNKVTVIQPKSAKAEKFYPPFFIKNPGYILSPGRHVIQFSDLKLLPAKEVKTK